MTQDELDAVVRDVKAKQPERKFHAGLARGGGLLHVLAGDLPGPAVSIPAVGIHAAQLIAVLDWLEDTAAHGRPWGEW